MELPVAPQVNGWGMLNSVKSSLEGKWIQFYRRIVCDLYVKFPRAQIKRIAKPWRKEQHHHNHLRRVTSGVILQTE